MSSSYHSQYPLLHIDLNQDHQEVFLFSSPKPAHDQVTYSSSSSSSSSSALLYPSFINPSQDGARYTHQGSNPNPVSQNEANTNVGSIVGSCELLNQTVPKLGRIKLSIAKKKDGANKIGNKPTEEGTNGNSAKWTSSKIRLAKKMVRSSDQLVADHRMPESSMKDHEQASSFRPDINNNMSETVAVRVCSDCHTTKTPLWRSGPRGPKSLCNACGIRQRKARRAMVAATAAANGTILEAGSAPPPPGVKTNKVQKKEKKASDSHLPFKKRCNNLKSRGRGRKKIGFEDLPMILSKNSTFHQVFPQDEKDAAILLMALSYGLVHG